MADIRELEGVTNYKDVYELLLDRHIERVNNKVNDCFYITEHKPVYTLGKRGGKENLLVDCGIEIFTTLRGGNITYHGPGQVVLYPVINIKKLGIGVKEYIIRLEEIVINTLISFGIRGIRDKKSHGVWYKDKKIASVGVRISNGVTLHGIALNVNVDLTPFTYINPCGIEGLKMTSLKSILKRDIDLKEIKKYVIQSITVQFKECFYA